MNTPVSFEIAKLLKEKGFDKITNKSYRISINPERPLPTEPIADEITYFPNVKESYSAPTIAEVVMWLYEKHGVWINPVPRLSSWIFTIQETKTSGNNSLIDIDFYGTNDYLKSKGVPTIMMTPTEAYEAAILYCLKELI